MCYFKKNYSLYFKKITYISIYNSCSLSLSLSFSLSPHCSFSLYTAPSTFFLFPPFSPISLFTAPSPVYLSSSSFFSHLKLIKYVSSQLKVEWWLKLQIFFGGFPFYVVCLQILICNVFHLFVFVDLVFFFGWGEGESFLVFVFGCCLRFCLGKFEEFS